MTPDQLLADPWAFGPWCWVVGEVRNLREPIPVRGMQGLWPLDEEHREVLSSLCPMGTYVRSALTLLQPYASAIAFGPKRVENRPWRKHIPAGGLWIGLHAGRELYGSQDNAELLLRGWRTGVLEEGPHWPEAPEVDALPRGLLLGAMRIDAILAYPELGALL